MNELYHNPGKNALLSLLGTEDYDAVSSMSQFGQNFFSDNAPYFELHPHREAISLWQFPTKDQLSPY